MLQPFDANKSNSLAYLSLGANETEDSHALMRRLQTAIAALDNPSCTVTEVSRFYVTPCFPPGAGPDYVNAAVAVETILNPADLLAHLHGIEASFGRQRKTRWEMRTLDIDLLAFAEEILPDLETFNHWRELPLAEQKQHAPEHLIVPHPRIQDRAFVLVPLADIAPDWVHPALGRSVSELLSSIDPEEIAAISPV